VVGALADDFNQQTEKPAEPLFFGDEPDDRFGSGVSFFGAISMIPLIPRQPKEFLHEAIYWPATNRLHARPLRLGGQYGQLGGLYDFTVLGLSNPLAQARSPWPAGERAALSQSPSQQSVALRPAVIEASPRHTLPYSFRYPT
jgi:hypothetical protein